MRVPDVVLFASGHSPRFVQKDSVLTRLGIMLENPAAISNDLQLGIEDKLAKAFTKVAFAAAMAEPTEHDKV